MEFNEKLHNYARVLLYAGCDIRTGDTIAVEIPAEHTEFAEILQEETGKAGGAECILFPYRTDGQPWTTEEHQKHLEMAEKTAEKKPCVIRLEMAEFADAYPDVEAFDEAQKQKREIRKMLNKYGRQPGTIACVPSRMWADRFVPELPEEDRYDALWDALLSCTHCMDEDPVGFWKNYISNTRHVKQKLDAMHFVQYHYQGEKSDFTFATIQGGFWMGGCVQTPERTFIPNLPTQEIFLGPDRRTVNGHIEAVLPLNYQGHIIEGIALDLENGRIQKYSASKGADKLTEIIETEEGTHWLGEVAAVESSSMIAAYHKLFYTTLYDENASCHVAIGNGLGPGDSAEREASGLNNASLHVDFMIGSASMNIYGQKEDGSWVQIFRNGKWILEENS